jgi:hypothetical protein
MIKGRDIIIVGLQPWDIPIGSNCKNIATELSKHNRVLYVNPPLDRSTYLKGQKQEAVQRRIEVIKGKSEGLVKIKMDSGIFIHPDWPSQLIGLVLRVSFIG